MSKFMFFDFRCRKCDAKSEQFVKPDVYTRTCESPDCDGTAVRCISAPRISLPGTDPDFTTAYSKWARMNKQKREQDAKFYDKHGVDKKHHSFGS